MWPIGQGHFLPQGHVVINNFGRGPLDDVIYQIWKIWVMWLKTTFWQPIFWPCDLLTQPIRTIWTNLVDHPGIIPVKFGQNPMSSFKGQDVNMLTQEGQPTDDDEWQTKTSHNSSTWAFWAQVSQYECKKEV